MRRVLLFMMTSLNGFYERGRWDEDPDGLDWHYTDDDFVSFAAQQLGEAHTNPLGRVTYEGMASYWPTPEAIAGDPAVAEKMNSMQKVVFSTTLDHVDWENSRLAQASVVEEVKALKQEPGKDIIILASSDLARSLAEHDLVDEYRIMVNPILLRGGKTVFEGLGRDVPLKLLEARAFQNGNVLLSYAPAKRGEPG